MYRFIWEESNIELATKIYKNSIKIELLSFISVLQFMRLDLLWNMLPCSINNLSIRSQTFEVILVIPYLTWINEIPTAHIYSMIGYTQRF